MGEESAVALAVAAAFCRCICKSYSHSNCVAFALGSLVVIPEGYVLLLLFLPLQFSCHPSPQAEDLLLLSSLSLLLSLFLLLSF